MTNLTLENLNEIIELEAMKKEIEAVLKAKKNAIKAEMKEAGMKSVKVENIKITYTEYASTTLDTKRIKEEFPEIYAEFGKVTTGERLTIK